jgi:hypothetical protein
MTRWQVALVASWAGCWGGSSTDEAPPGTPESAPTDAPAPAPAFPADGSALRAALPTDLVTPRFNEMSGEQFGVAVGLAAPTDVFGARCRDEVLVMDGTFSCTLDAPYTADDLVTPAGASLTRHYGTGKRAAIVLAELDPAQTAMNVGGVACREFVHTFPDGSVETCVLQDERMFGAHRVRSGTLVTLYPSGGLNTAVVHEHHEFVGRPLSYGTAWFAEDGSLIDVNEGYVGD